MSCTCLSISRDPLCEHHGDIDKVKALAPPQAREAEDNALVREMRMIAIVMWGHVLRLCEKVGCQSRGVLRDNGGSV
jgi:hypothetical protein